MVYVGIDVAKDKHDCFITNSGGEVLFSIILFTILFVGVSGVFCWLFFKKIIIIFDTKTFKKCLFYAILVLVLIYFRRKDGNRRRFYPENKVAFHSGKNGNTIDTK